MNIGYVKVSKADSSEVLNEQTLALKSAGILEANIYTDKVTDESDDRPELASCLSSLLEDDTLTVWKLDQLGRDLKHLLDTVDDLSKRKINFKVLNCKGSTIDTSLPEGKLIFAVFASLAEFEREQSLAGLKTVQASDTKIEPKPQTPIIKPQIPTKPQVPKKQAGFGIFINALQADEQSVFDKVIAFKVALGLSAHISNNGSTASLIITTKEAMPDINVSAKQVVIVVDSILDSGLGDLTVARPLSILSVRKAINEAVELVEQREDNTDDVKDDAKVVKKDEKPAASKPPVAKADSAANRVEDCERQEGQHHALVIDDTLVIHTQLKVELQDAGITADFALSGEEALEKSEKEKYDLIFLDVMMPGIDGYETCKRMRATDTYKKTPIIMLSGKTSPMDEVKGVMVGATTYLTKPVQSDKLQETLNRVSKWLDISKN